MMPPRYRAPAAAVAGVLLLGATSLPAFADAETARSVTLGYSFSDNLEVQPGNALEPDAGALSRQGLILGLALVRQKLTPSGGYSIAASGRYNRGFANDKRDDDIADASLVATRLLALSPDWLARLSAGARYYDSGPLPLTSHGGLSAAATLGYLGRAASGVDLGISLKQERHDAVADDEYAIRRTRATLRYYLPRERNGPTIAFSTSLARNDADAATRSYDSFGLDASLRGWRLGPVTLRAGIGWQRDSYDRVTRTTAMPGGATQPPPNGRPGDPGRMEGMRNGDAPSAPIALGGSDDRREDRTGYAWLGIDHRLRRGLWLRGDISAGRYRSSAQDDSESFYRLSLTLSRDF